MNKKLSKKTTKISKKAQKNRQKILSFVLIAVVVIAMAFVVKYLQSSDQSSYADADMGTKIVQIETYSHIANGSCWRFSTANPEGEKLWNCTDSTCTKNEVQKCFDVSKPVNVIASAEESVAAQCTGSADVSVYKNLGKNQEEISLGSTNSSCTINKPASFYCKVNSPNKVHVTCNDAMDSFVDYGRPLGSVELGTSAELKSYARHNTYCSVVQSDSNNEDHAFLVMWIDADGNYCWNGYDTNTGIFEGCNLGAYPNTKEGGFQTYFPRLNWADCVTRPTPTVPQATKTPPPLPTSQPSPTPTAIPSPTPVEGACSWKGMLNPVAQYRNHELQNGQIVVTQQVRPVIERSFTIDRRQNVAFKFTMDQVKVKPSATREGGTCSGQPNEEAFVEVYKKLGGGVLELVPHINNPTKFTDNIEADRNGVIKTLNLDLEAGAYLIRSTWAGDGRRDPTAPANTVNGGAPYYTNFSQDAGEPAKLRYPDRALDRVCQWDGSYKIKLEYCTI